MSIRKMKALTLLAPAGDAKKLLRALQRLGCVELCKAEEDGEALFDGFVRCRNLAREAQQALAVLDHYVPAKGSFLSPKREVSASRFWDKKRQQDGIRKARNINAVAQRIDLMSAKEAQLTAESMSLSPWVDCAVPLNTAGTRTVSLLFGTLPAREDLPAVEENLQTAASLSVLYPLSRDKDLQYLAVLVHRSEEAAALELLHGYSFAAPAWKEVSGTARDRKNALDRETEQLRKDRETEKEKLSALGESREEIEELLDVLQQDLQREEAADNLRKRGSVAVLKGWLPEEREEELNAFLQTTDCAWELCEPTEEEYAEVPVSLKNNRFTDALNMVTEMYSLPAYGTLDPNPLMAPFFVLFYGIMMADMGYGILMVLAGALLLKKKKPEGTFKHLSALLVYCGISTFAWGAITGGFFGDFIPQLAKLINPASTFEFPSLFTPLNDTLMILVGAMALGFVQIVTGMAISFVEKLKAGKVLDAVFEELTWWVVFAGIGVMVLQGSKLVLYAGIALVVLGPVITGKGAGKLTGIFASLYNHVTGFFGDILSYARLMALMLAGSVIAQVFNTLGAIPGNIIFFLIISIAGNALNFALNLLGCYVHDLRLQCLEYFGKFYTDGGKPFRPLAIRTKYVNIKN